MLDDRRLTAKLWEVVEALARLRVFLEQTDHLSDREVYARPWRETLREPVRDMPPDESSAWYTDLTGSGSEDERASRVNGWPFFFGNYPFTVGKE